MTEEDLETLKAAIEQWSELRTSFLATLCDDLERLKRDLQQHPDRLEAFTWGLDQLDALLTWHDREAQLLRIASVRIAGVVAELADQAKVPDEPFDPSDQPASLH